MIQKQKYQLLLVGGLTMLFLGFAYIYKQYDPETSAWFPKCPMKSLTGLDCPGCGSQRALHQLLNGHLKEAFQQNALLIPFIPYLTLGYGYRFIKNPNARILKWRKILFGESAIKVLIVVILLYSIYRNVG
ncbi:DUF2752 domain-containing protein [Sphingobacterium psychroaquaticum]|uniref:DUF2752 domain-containing protein n=1 Tax=Sphingobacterium psychroaquaticum TaxID=561061 RepID=UPI001181B346|nr:DUF2752 domain-containing protein [Sphingobacterium psychroaquaticum]